MPNYRQLIYIFEKIPAKIKPGTCRSAVRVYWFCWQFQENRCLETRVNLKKFYIITSSFFSATFTKGNNLRDILFAFLDHKSLQRLDPLSESLLREQDLSRFDPSENFVAGQGNLERI